MISVSGASEATGEAAASTTSWAPGDGEGRRAAFSYRCAVPGATRQAILKRRTSSPGKASCHRPPLGRYQVGDFAQHFQAGETRRFPEAR